MNISNNGRRTSDLSETAASNTNNNWIISVSILLFFAVEFCEFSTPSCITRLRKRVDKIWFLYFLFHEVLKLLYS